MSGFVNRKKEKYVLDAVSTAINEHLSDSEFLELAYNPTKETPVQREHIMGCSDCLTIGQHIREGDTEEETWGLLEPETRERAERLRDEYLFATQED